MKVVPLLAVGLVLTSAATATGAVGDFPVSILKQLETQVMGAFATYTTIRQQAASIVSDGRATMGPDPMFLHATFVRDTVTPWYRKEEAVREGWAQLWSITDGIQSSGCAICPRSQRAGLLIQVFISLDTAINQLYDAISGTAAFCNITGNALDFKAADLLEQKARLAYAGKSTDAIDSRIDAVAAQQMNAPERTNRCGSSKVLPDDHSLIIHLVAAYDS
jgi:hypothetical protein